MPSFQSRSTPVSPVRASVTVSVQVPGDSSPRNCTLEKLKLRLSFVVPMSVSSPATLPARSTKVETVPSGEVRVMIRSPTWVWVRSIESVTWPISISSVTSMVEVMLPLSASVTSVAF